MTNTRAKKTKIASIFIILSACYVALRFQLNSEYAGATWQQLYDLTAPLPFGYRLLVPLLSRANVFLGFSLKEAYIFWEFVSTFLSLIGTYLVLAFYIKRKHALVFSSFLVIVLVPVFLLWILWPVYYPSDTASIAFLLFGFYFLISRNFFVLSLVLFFATLNRESSLLLIMLFAVFCIDQLKFKRFLFWFFILSIAYIFGRAITGYLTANNPMPYQAPYAFTYDQIWRVDNNIAWIKDFKNCLILLGSCALTPVFYLALRKYIPKRMRRINIVSVSYLLPLVYVGNLNEPRIFGELVTLTYILICIGTYSFLTGTTVSIDDNTVDNLRLNKAVSFAEKYYLAAILVIFFAIYFYIQSKGVSYFFPNLS